MSPDPNHGYLSNPTFRGMRWHLMQTFDQIQVIDLHGNANKKEVSPDGSPDKNVFDIRQGVSIIVAVKKRGKSKNKPLATVKRLELWGDRDAKNEWLWKNSTKSQFDEVDSFAKYYMFYNISREKIEIYERGVSLGDFFQQRSVGAVTGRDSINISFSREESVEKIKHLVELPDAEARRYFAIKEKDARDWTLKTAKADAATADISAFSTLDYRPFDKRWTCYTGNSRGLYASPQTAILKHIRARANVALVMNKSLEGDRPFADALVFNDMVQHHSLSLKEVNYVAPLYLHPEEGTLDQTIRVNFNPKLYAEIRKAAGLTGIPATPDGADTFRKASGDARSDEVKVFDYIYGVLHCPEYRATYAEFLKIDFPRIPFPASPESFRAISEQGEALRRLHLMEDASIGATPYPFHGDGDSVVDKPRHENGQVWINADQYFDGVPAIAWEFHIGGYQPAQKWLKDRKGRALTYDDIRHYQRIIKILAETDRIMRTIEVPLD